MTCSCEVFSLVLLIGFLKKVLSANENWAMFALLPSNVV